MALPDPPVPALDRHTRSEDALALVTGTFFIALGVLFLGQARLLTGGTAGIAFLLHYAAGLSFGQAFFSTWAQPVRCPPVPTPVISTSAPSGKSASNSRAVVRACASMFDALSNCCGIHAPGVSETICCARSIHPGMPFSRGISTNLAP